MSLEMFQLLFGLFLGLAIALFHRPLADFMHEQEHAIDFIFRSRGLRLPPPLSQSMARDVYFALGVVVALLEAGRLLMLTR
jgi:hypothetical protein